MTALYLLAGSQRHGDCRIPTYYFLGSRGPAKTAVHEVGVSAASTGLAVARRGPRGPALVCARRLAGSAVAPSVARPLRRLRETR
jgi:hypothetical protein